MKFYHIALYIFCFNLGISILNGVDVFGNYIQHDTEWAESVQEIGEESNQAAYEVNPTYIFGDFIKGLQLFGRAVGNATILLPFFLTQLGVPDQLAGAITSGSWLTYGIGILQFVSGRSVRNYE